MSDALIGQKLGQYEIRMLLGKGGMSSVYLAYQSSMDRVVAVKVLPREFLHDETFLTRFQREVRTIAKLEHPYILPVYDVGEADGLPYLVMRYIGGGTVADLIESKLPRTGTIVRITGQVASALDYAHERGIIHRDLKPSNVLLDGSGNAYLADFGIARLQEDISITDASRVMGTPSYVAPEMVRQGEDITASVDIYALGAMTYEMFTGDPPYVTNDPTAALMAHVMEPVPSIRDFDPNISPAADRVVQRALAKTPADRYQSAGLFVADLARALQVPQGKFDVPARDDDGGPPTIESGLRPVSQDTQPTHVPDVPREAPAYSSPPPYYEPAPSYSPPPSREPEEERRPRRMGGCLLGMGVLFALLAGMVVAAFAFTGGDPGSLLAVLTPIITFGPDGQPAADGSTPEPQGEPTVNGGAESASTPTPSDPSILPAPGSGGRLAFASSRDGDYEIYLIEVDGSNLQQLTDNTTYDFDPDWSPDGNRIVYVTTIGGYAEIIVMDADGGNAEQITENREIKDADPAWSPMGGRIAFSSDRDGDFDIYTMNPDGSDVQPVTLNDDLDDLNPAWSPDGSRLVYYATNVDGGTTELYMVDAAGGEPERLTRNDVLDQWPDWSPDGVLIAFTSAQGLAGSSRAIFTYDLTTRQTQQISDGERRDDDPVWSPDGSRIAFDSDRDGDGVFDVFVFDMGTGEVLRVSASDANDVAPAWQPLR